MAVGAIISAVMDIIRHDPNIGSNSERAAIRTCVERIGVLWAALVSSHQHFCFGLTTITLPVLSHGGHLLDLDFALCIGGIIHFAMSYAPFTSHDPAYVLAMPGNSEATVTATLENDRRRREYCANNNIPFLELRGNLSIAQRTVHVDYVINTGEVRVVSQNNTVLILDDNFNIAS